MKRLLVVFVLVLVVGAELFALHLRAADIVVERVPGSTTEYLVRLTVFSDNDTDEFDGTPNGIQLADPQEIFLNNESTPRLASSVVKGVNVGNNTNKSVYETIVEVPSPNGKFFIKWNGILRNEGIVNIQSVSETPYSLYIESFFFLNGFDEPNNSPQMSIDPVDKGYVDAVYTYNSGAYDVDGDSLSYELIPIRAGSTNSSGAMIGNEIPGTVSPNDPSIGGGGELEIDPVRGTITWGSPKVTGEYNVAIKISEWRNGIRIGYVVRDIQIIIEDNNLEPPMLEVPNDTCVVAGSALKADIIAWDVNNDDVLLEYYGLPKELGALMPISKGFTDSVVGSFSWSISCEEPRDQPYYSYFKAISNPTKSYRLSTYKEWAISVIGAPIQGVQVSNQEGGVELLWDQYCGQSDKLSGIEVWRRSCDTLAVVRDYCVAGVPSDWGFQKIADLESDAISYLDENVFKGSNYFYTLVAKISDINAGLSVASDIVSTETTIDGPWIAQASVLEHDSTKGKVLVDWYFSSFFNEVGPYKVELLRSDSLNGGEYLSIDTLSLNTIKDSSFTDSLLDTYNGEYSYKIKVYYESNKLFSESESVSIIDLEAVADQRGINLGWDVIAPLFTPDSLFNKIHKGYPLFGVLDSINGEINAYADLDLESDSLYCYYIVKPTAYCNGEIDTIFEVVSSISCDTTFDFDPPCPPILSLNALYCEEYDPAAQIQNELWWEWDVYTCNEEKIQYYELFYKAKEEDDFRSIVQTIDTFYIHQFINTYAGCYKIRTLDKSGNLGWFSNVVCNDNCQSIEFPNVVTPNGDDKNDVFGPIPFPQFVNEIHFTVINRWGKMVFQGVSNVGILWDLKNSDGEEVSDGVYYYEAVVAYDKYRKEDREEIFKGWIYVVSE